MKTKILASVSLSVMLGLMPICAMAQTQSGYYTKECNSPKLQSEATKWLKKGEWRQGFNGASPDKSVNVVEFYTQYQKNPEQWKALFKWLSETDLLSISKGKHPIPGSTLTASVEDSYNEELSKRGSESHYHHIDFQFVVKGTERFGLIDHITSKPSSQYRPDVIHYDYQLEQTKFIDSRTDRFFIFFPCDWHIAKVKTDKADQNIRVVVVKVDYVE
jgi:biofilm protein TabA